LCRVIGVNSTSHLGHFKSASVGRTSGGQILQRAYQDRPD
jgi:hypothetical protein